MSVGPLVGPSVARVWWKSDFYKSSRVSDSDCSDTSDSSESGDSSDSSYASDGNDKNKNFGIENCVIRKRKKLYQLKNLK